jgi:MarR family transcriptional regulator, negative regulator of the multidrug operon emrRAB
MKKIPDPSPLLRVMLSRLQQSQQRHPGFPRDQAVLVRLVKLLHRLFNDSANVLLREHGLNHPEYNVLIMLDGSADGLSPGDLAEATSEKAANTTRLVDQLLAKGLVTRSPCSDDRRRLLVRLSPQGEALLEMLIPLIAGQLDGFFAPLDNQERRLLEHLLQRMVAGVEGGQ